MLNKTILILTFIFFANSAFTQEKLAIAEKFTPVLNTPYFGDVFGGYDGLSVKLNKKGLIGEMEFIAYPQTKFKVLETINKNGYDILRVTTEDYPYTSSELFIDSRFVYLVNNSSDDKVKKNIPDRIKEMPLKDKIISNLNSLESYPYMWGGNFADGISEMLEYYQPSGNIDYKTKELWILKGVDCSGLLYQATEGCTPRNTSSLIDYGNAVDIKGSNAEKIVSKLKPLDLICWNGHVVIVLDAENTIESTPDYGVHKTNLLNRIKRILNERKPVNDWSLTNGKRFVVRRWYE